MEGASDRAEKGGKSMERDNGLAAWEANAAFWDEVMGDESNGFHRKIVRPFTEELLEVRPNDLVLDVACGNGNFSKRLAEKGADVVAFDYSTKMIALAKKRRADYLDNIDFRVCDATDGGELLKLRHERPFNKAVANMALMDISEIAPLMGAVHEMLAPGGTFVFSTHHPSFTYPNEDYFTSCVHRGEAIPGQPTLQNYYHRSLEDIFRAAFAAGFVVDGFHEVPLQGEKIPIIIVVRLRKP